VWAQILYPNAAGFGAQQFGQVSDPELRRLCATLFNDAMAEIQEESGDRLLPMALMPWWDIEASVAEAVRSAERGLRGINMCSDPQNVGLPDLGDRAWDPLWEVCADQHLPVNFHIGASETSLTWFGTSPWPSQDDERRLAIGSAMMYLSNARVLANLIFSGVLERFPALQVVSVESGVGWIPSFLEALDYQQTESAPHSVDILSMKPSDYFRRQMFGCFWFEHGSVPAAIDALGADRILFETDYPHPTCLYPDPLTYVASLEPLIGEENLRKVVQDNAAKLYRIEI
jgi:predicted TIM-barrel fold metal-dependent hydrolase